MEEGASGVKVPDETDGESQRALYGGEPSGSSAVLGGDGPKWTKAPPPSGVWSAHEEAPPLGDSQVLRSLSVMSNWRSEERRNRAASGGVGRFAVVWFGGWRPQQSTTRPIHARQGRRTSETTARSRLGARSPASALRSKDRTGAVTREAERRVMTPVAPPRRGRRSARDCQQRNHRAPVDGGEARSQRQLARGSALARRRWLSAQEIERAR